LAPRSSIKLAPPCVGKEDASAGRSIPSIGILNIGSEDLKGRDVLREAATLLRDSTLAPCFKGFVEGDDISKGTVNVVVTDGFTGNVALKTAEGVAKMISLFMKETLRSNLLSKLGYLLARSSFEELKKKLDVRLYNGGVFLGLNGLCMKSHGSMDGGGFANALARAASLVRQDFIERIRDQLEKFAHVLYDPVDTGPSKPILLEGHVVSEPSDSAEDTNKRAS
jgi:glycerol-3-phosphate acyltransferase PlsX